MRNPHEIRFAKAFDDLHRNLVIEKLTLSWNRTLPFNNVIIDTEKYLPGNKLS